MAQPSDQSGKRRSGGKSPNAYRTISEVAEEVDVPAHVLRFWEGKFTQVKPMKRAGGRRYYRPDDIVLLQRIRELLYDHGYTIKGVQKILREGGVKAALDRGTDKVAGEDMAVSRDEGGRPLTASEKTEIETVLSDLRGVRDLLRRGAE